MVSGCRSLRLLTCAARLTRMLKAPYTMGFMHELVTANMNSPFWMRWSTLAADFRSYQYLQHNTTSD
jgi:hypothetical protein